MPSETAIMRGTTRRRSGSGRIAEYQDSRFAPTIEVTNVVTAKISVESKKMASGPVTQAERDQRAPSRARYSPRGSEIQATKSVRPRRLPSVRSSSRGTTSWAMPPTSGRTPSSTATKGGQPIASANGMTTSKPARTPTTP